MTTTVPHTTTHDPPTPEPPAPERSDAEPSAPEPSVPEPSAAEPSAPGTRDDESLVGPAWSEIDKRDWWRGVVLTNIVLALAVGLYLVTGTPAPADPEPSAAPPLAAGPAAAPEQAPEQAPEEAPGQAPEQGSGQAPDEAPAPAVETATPETAPTAPTAATPSPEEATAPRVRAKIRTDLTAGAPWPFGVGNRDTASVGWDIAVLDGLFVHGPAQGPDAVSWLEKWLRTDVRSVGARVRFARADSGSVAITAWHTSVLDDTGTTTPDTGLRLVASPGRWRLVVKDASGTSALASGRYDQVGRTARFEVVRRGPVAWVTDPAGQVVRVRDPRVASLAGPWASWELRETGPQQNPAAIEALWAG